MVGEVVESPARSDVSSTFYNNNDARRQPDLSNVVDGDGDEKNGVRGVPDGARWSEAGDPSSSSVSGGGGRLPGLNFINNNIAKASVEGRSSGVPGTSGHQLQDARTLPVSAYQTAEQERRGGAEARRIDTDTDYGLKGGQPMMNRTAVELLSPAISNSHDALHLLSEAAGRTEDLNRQSIANRYAGNHNNRQPMPSFDSPVSSLAHAATSTSQAAGGTFPKASLSSSSPGSGFMSSGNFYQDGGLGSRVPGPVVPGPGPVSVAGGRMGSAPSQDPDPGHVDAVKVWSRLRFVRAGWLSVDEAMAYVQ